MTFVGVCEAFVNICQKKNIEKKEKRMKMRFGFYSKVIHVQVYEITDEKMGFQNYEKTDVHKPLLC